MNEQNSLFFIPDISGFTKFVNETEISHSQLIISELLELIIDANKLGLEVSEIEGDAVFFHRFGPAPKITELADQAKKMFIDFHRYLKKYELYRLCQCRACKSADNLTLKIITHYGQAQKYKVKEHTKLIGRDVITVHRLMKNTVAHNEYLLITDEAAAWGKIEDVSGWFKPESGADAYDEIGNITYKYSSLSPLLEEVRVDEPEDTSLKDPVKMYEQVSTINAPMEDIFAVMIDLPARSKWVSGVTDIIVYDNKPNHIGTVHKCLQGDGDPDVITSRVKVTNSTMEFWETEKKKTYTCRYFLEKEEENKTKITVELFIKNNIMLKTIMKLFMLKKLSKKFTETSAGLKKYCEEKAKSPESKEQLIN